jgi:hypothetical protein
MPLAGCVKTQPKRRPAIPVNAVAIRRAERIRVTSYATGRSHFRSRSGRLFIGTPILMSAADRKAAQPEGHAAPMKHLIASEAGSHTNRRIPTSPSCGEPWRGNGRVPNPRAHEAQPGNDLSRERMCNPRADKGRIRDTIGASVQRSGCTKQSYRFGSHANPAAQTCKRQRFRRFGAQELCSRGESPRIVPEHRLPLHRGVFLALWHCHADSCRCRACAFWWPELRYPAI